MRAYEGPKKGSVPSTAAIGPRSDDSQGHYLKRENLRDGEGAWWPRRLPLEAIRISPIGRDETRRRRVSHDVDLYSPRK